MRNMKKSINTNSIPYLFLTIIHIGLFSFLLKRKNNTHAWILFLSNVGFAFLFEYPTLNLFHGYRYKPSIMKKRFFDVILGAILSQAVYVPISATFLTLFKKNWKWKMCLSIMYVGIEKLFIHLKIYKVFWWKPIFTPFLIFIYFHISDLFFKALSNQNKWALKTAHFLSVEVLFIMLLYLVAAKRQIRFGIGMYHTSTEHFKIVPLYSLILSSLATFTSSKSGAIYRFLMIFCHIFIDVFLVKKGLLKVNFKRRLNYICWYLTMIFISKFLYKTIYHSNDF
ncbi:hypothetical protein [Halalkalibacter akibai]|uniref:Uncharacterized protein n=1 Tax=Halalkalibacter akibai (strain ATCC 43226 / DSM 21942 / CIP 109018 / JCM 9157 / 1139) TaxID=1236973 RepID=W4QVU4_HALA3|nr:hypothetical protein [Halalkalibacter akibai]GAE36012.1 hypothetical protein JCM9157_3156 [Halalkalibacter akibai JCM 9157]